MSYSTGTVSGLNNAVNTISTLATTAGWTVNDLSDDASKYDGDTFTGRRLHIQKTIGATTVYANFRSASNQGIFAACNTTGSDYNTITGIGCYLSTGYNGALDWDQQAGFPTDNRAEDKGTGGCIRDALDTTNTYHCFYQDSTFSIVFETGTGYLAISIGVTDTGKPFYMTSGGKALAADYYFAVRHRYLVTNIAGPQAHCGLISGSDYYLSESIYIGDNPLTLLSQYEFRSAETYSEQNTRSMGAPSLYYSPDPVRGNAPLVPIEFLTNTLKSTGQISDVRLVRSTYIDNESDITTDSGTFKVFGIRSKTDTFGMAFKK